MIVTVEKTPLTEIDYQVGCFSLENRNIGKSLCFEKGGFKSSIKLTKKSYKILKRSSRFIGSEVIYELGDTKESVDDDEEFKKDVAECCGVYDVGKEHYNSEAYASKMLWPHNKTLKKEPSPFVMEWFKCPS